jgi:hypothetical protein
MIWKCMSVLGVFAASSAWAAPMVTMSGECPGVVTITVDNIAPGECIGIAYGDDAGGAGETVSRGDCSGTVMGLEPLHYAFSACDHDGDGSITFTPDISADACGTSFQVLDMGSCEASDVERIDLSATSEAYYDLYDAYYYSYYGPTPDDYYTNPSYWTDYYAVTTDWTYDYLYGGTVYTPWYPAGDTYYTFYYGGITTYYVDPYYGGCWETDYGFTICT